ncbi:arylsulfatase [Formosa sp. Hel3_A1_48]|jgi:arylsulfatase A-like enzyme|uniref:sulfatase family protein n=1 Tax=Formosa sp. Hel3_A1_48 TaxID=1336795 RepID=UPI00084E0FC8|nr:arylsulfatase [Formosa sp. Hel3_A1_48]AOR25449.1 arylsulfatase [Formosa sp. Hel3_A1_48]MDG1284875.1 arylsulfatase [Flavobacteriaceae bacterium]MDG2483737.1 arylsulfatase [Flavobacteriaceae bacterium]
MYSKKITWGLIIIVLLTFSCTEKKAQNKSSKNSTPNIVIIYTDDLGFGDISANGATEIQTPNIDKLANNGIRFTNGFSSSATCTPSRYALLTGIYPWKNKRARILPGTAPLIIDTAQATLPKMLKNKGYHTGIVGKWHLGLGSGNVDWNKRVSPGPNEVGFDYAYIMAATQDRVPTVYIENGNVVGLDPNDPIEIDYANNFEGEPNGLDNPELISMKWHHGHNNSIVNGIPRIGFMRGGESAKWSDIDMADHFLVKAQDYVKQHKNEPFFLYYAMQQPHVPRTPHPRFVGTSGMGPRGDVILEADWCVGEFIKTLDDEGLLENTLIIFSSDNGPVLNDGYFDQAVEKIGNHKPNGVFRGGKYSLFEAGTRVPFIVYWKNRIAPKVSNALISQIDIMASIGTLIGSDIENTDSQKMWNVLSGQSDQGRNSLIIEATTRTAYKQGDWVMIPPYGGPEVLEQVNIEIGNSSNYQLYNLKDDKSQQNNLANSKPEKLQELIKAFNAEKGNANTKVEAIELK